MNLVDIEQKIKNSIPDAEVMIQTNDNVHYNAIVISDKFIGLSRIKQHQLVLETIKYEIASEKIHAFSLRTYNVKSWHEFNNASSSSDCNSGCACH